MDCLLSDDDISGEESEDLDDDLTVSKDGPDRQCSQVETEVDDTRSNEPDDIRNKRERKNFDEENRNNAFRDNTRALPKHALTYELEKFEKKLLVIFNHINFNCKEKEPRVGTDKDVIALTKTFGNFGFTVTVNTDWEKDKIIKKLNSWADKDYSDYGCFAVAVLTHGDKYGDLMAKDKLYNEEEIINSLKTNRNKTFTTKPRILLIQACRGSDDLEGVTVYPKVYKDNAGIEQPYTLPREADMLIMHSSYAGKSSHRTDNGSWFIQTLCKQIDDLALEEDLLSILQHTNRIVATDFEVSKYDVYKTKRVTEKQMPVITTTLTRKLYLRKYRA